MLKEFRDFILRGNVVDLAVAVVLGAAFGAVVAGFVSSFITPLIAAVGGETTFSDLVFTINGARFTYGEFIDVLIRFVVVAGVVFFLIIKPMNLVMKRVRRAETPVSDAPGRGRRAAAGDPRPPARGDGRDGVLRR